MLLSTLALALLAPAFAAPTPLYTFSPRSALATASIGSDLSPKEAKEVTLLAGVAKWVVWASQIRMGLTCSDAFFGSTSARGHRLLAESQLGDDEMIGGPACESSVKVYGIAVLTSVGQISHDPKADTIYLAFTSPPPEDLLEILASSSPSEPDHLTPLPPTILNHGPLDRAMIYTPYLPYLIIVEDATNALCEHLAILRSPSIYSRVLSKTAGVLGIPYSPRSAPAPHIEIVGHGLGSVLGLLSSLSLHTQHPELAIHSTLFSMPKAGDQAFAHLVDDILKGSGEDRLQIRRISHGSDPVPSLPPAHYGLFHPLVIRDIRLGQQDIQVGNGRLEDGLGPFMGQTIGAGC
jgi:hypothetical protein